MLSWIAEAKHDNDKANGQVAYTVLYDTRIFWICWNLALWESWESNQAKIKYTQTKQGLCFKNLLK